MQNDAKYGIAIISVETIRIAPSIFRHMRKNFLPYFFQGHRRKFFLPFFFKKETDLITRELLLYSNLKTQVSGLIRQCDCENFT